MMEFSGRLKELRLTKNLTQQEFGEKFGVSKNTQQIYESGKRVPDAAYLIALANDGYDVKYLLTGEKDRSNLNHKQMEWLSLFDNASLEVREDVLDVLMFEQSGDLQNERFVRIPRMSASGSMGLGIPANLSHDDVVDSVILQEQWLRRMLMNFSSIKNLRIVTGHGDSMSDTFKDGDALFIDIGITEFTDDAVYMFEIYNDIRIKRLQALKKGKIKMISDNKKYDSMVIEPDDQFRIIGRIVGKWAFDRL